ncbi:MAG: glycosyltransferase [Vicinamibacterales bacterium]
MPTHVVRVITRLNVGGPSIQAALLSARLAGRGFTTTLVHGRLGPGEGDMSYLLEGQGVDARYLPALRRPVAPFADLAAAWALFRILRETRPAVLHTHMAKAGTLGRLAAVAYNLTPGRGPRLRVVHTYHGHVLEGYFGALKTRVFLEVERTLARVTDRLVAISPRIRDELLAQYAIGVPGQYAVVPLGFDLGPFAAVDAPRRAAARRALGLAAGEVAVTTAGRLTAIKQHQLFLQMARLVIARHPNARFLIAGDGEDRAMLEAQVARDGLQGHVRFLGWWRDLPELYAATDVFALTSRNEGTPVALIEAMASGVPGVATDVGGVRDVIPDATVGLVVPFGQPEALAAAVAELAASPEARRAMGARARASVVDRYGSDRLVADIEALYRGLIGEEVPGPGAP